MKIGAVFPQIELQGDPAAVDRIGRAAEALGYDHFVMYDHVVGAVHEDRNPPLWAQGPYTDKDPFHDPLVVFGYLAGITRRLEFMTAVLILPQRQTVLVAKQCTDIDLLSGGRLRLGVGAGWNYVEYDALGQDFKTRGSRLSEQIGYLRRLWSEPLVTFKGRFDTIDRANIVPRPQRRIPIYCGGFSEPAYQRAVKLADGFVFGGSLAESALPGWARVRRLLAEAGRPVDEFGAEYLVQDSRAGGLSVGEAVNAVQRWQDAGGTHASVVTMGRGFETADQHIDHLADVRQRLAAVGF
jgi:probable F420-dependent oxidoreductase